MGTEAILSEKITCHPRWTPTRTGPSAINLSIIVAKPKIVSEMTYDVSRGLLNPTKAHNLKAQSCYSISPHNDRRGTQDPGTTMRGPLWLSVKTSHYSCIFMYDQGVVG